MYCLKIQEAELISKVKRDFFNKKEFDSTRMFGEIDFCISYKSDTLFSSINFLWAEAKRGKADLIEAFIQLIITIGREKTFANEQPLIFLGAFNAQK